ncbi:MAG: 6-bladed beta-propeller [Candidatus Delongbacteria bacterium]|nr:6-bladed beta-propeller [Candidatus Delongbacteria bacterium]MBN2835448.1 6-bladed beta-propeller [Candidatus Delongbacteria bacterium]
MKKLIIGFLFTLFPIFAAERIVKDGYELVVNPSKIENGNFEVEMKQLYRIDADTKVLDFTVADISYGHSVEFDADENIYFIENSLKKILKFNREGDFVACYGNEGKGPGEYDFLNSFTIDKNGLFYIPNHTGMKMMQYGKDFKFIKDIEFNNSQLPSSLVNFGDYFIGSSLLFTFTDGKSEKGYDIALYDDTFTKLKTFKEDKKEVDLSKPMDMTGDIIRFSVDNLNNKVYIARNDISTYFIDVYDESGNKIQEIERKYRKIYYTDEEREDLNNRYKVIINGEKLKVDAKYKPSIEKILVDKNGYLWVDPAEDKGLDEKNLYDIYKNGELIAQIDLDNLLPEKFTFFSYDNGKILGTDEEKNLLVFEIFIK